MLEEVLTDDPGDVFLGAESTVSTTTVCILKSLCTTTLTPPLPVLLLTTTGTNYYCVDLGCSIVCTKPMSQLYLLYLRLQYRVPPFYFYLFIYFRERGLPWQLVHHVEPIIGWSLVLSPEGSRHLTPPQVTAAAFFVTAAAAAG